MSLSHEAMFFDLVRNMIAYLVREGPFELYQLGADEHSQLERKKMTPHNMSFELPDFYVRKLVVREATTTAYRFVSGLVVSEEPVVYIDVNDLKFASDELNAGTIQFYKVALPVQDTRLLNRLAKEAHGRMAARYTETMLKLYETDITAICEEWHRNNQSLCYKN